MAIYKDPHNVTWYATATTGCKSINEDGGGQPGTSRSEDGVLTHFVVSGGIAGSVEYEDPDEAAKIADKVSAGHDLTFDVEDEGDAQKTVTITNIKTGGVRSNYVNGAPAGFSVPFVADSISEPVAP